MFEEKGTLSVVGPKKLWGDLWLVSKVLEKLNLYKTRDEAIESLNQNSLPSIGEVFH
jgi:hypothetical protein